jgi:hypothetical protein
LVITPSRSKITAAIYGSRSGLCITVRSLQRIDGDAVWASYWRFSTGEASAQAEAPPTPTRLPHVMLGCRSIDLLCP